MFLASSVKTDLGKTIQTWIKNVSLFILNSDWGKYSHFPFIYFHWINTLHLSNCHVYNASMVLELIVILHKNHFIYISATDLSLHWSSEFKFILQFVVPWIGTYYLTLLIEIATHICFNMKNVFCVTLESLFFVHKSPASDCYYIERELYFLFYSVSDVAFSRFKHFVHGAIPWSAFLKVLDFPHTLNVHSCLFLILTVVYILIIYVVVLQNGVKERGRLVWHALHMLCLVPLSKIIFLCCTHSMSSVHV